MLNITSEVAIDLSKYIDDSGDLPMVRGSELPVATIAYRAMSGSWSLCQLAYEFLLQDAEILAALLYYAQFKDSIDSGGVSALEFEALD